VFEGGWLASIRQSWGAPLTRSVLQGLVTVQVRNISPGAPPCLPPSWVDARTCAQNHPGPLSLPPCTSGAMHTICSTPTVSNGVGWVALGVGRVGGCWMGCFSITRFLKLKFSVSSCHGAAGMREHSVSLGDITTALWCFCALLMVPQ
jgi:hypothetical protein